jgi:hypothetical protein
MADAVQLQRASSSARGGAPSGRTDRTSNLYLARICKDRICMATSKPLHIASDESLTDLLPVTASRVVFGCVAGLSAHRRRACRMPLRATGIFGRDATADASTVRRRHVSCAHDSAGHRCRLSSTWRRLISGLMMCCGPNGRPLSQPRSPACSSLSARRDRRHVGAPSCHPSSRIAAPGFLIAFVVCAAPADRHATGDRRCRTRCAIRRFSQ